jgi:S-adenosylmethionine:tRNA ribosyltransferase-isomerase
VEKIDEHRMEPEEYQVSSATAALLSQALAEKRRIIAVGTTTTRTLESLTIDGNAQVQSGHGSTDMFIHPGHTFRVVSGLITNFHLPKSSLLMLVAAFSGREHVLNAYKHAVAQRYRFYSYGDAMLIV